MYVGTIPKRNLTHKQGEIYDSFKVPHVPIKTVPHMFISPALLYLLSLHVWQLNQLDRKNSLAAVYYHRRFPGVVPVFACQLSSQTTGLQTVQTTPTATHTRTHTPITVRDEVFVAIFVYSVS